MHPDTSAFDQASEMGAVQAVLQFQPDTILQLCMVMSSHLQSCIVPEEKKKSLGEHQWEGLCVMPRMGGRGILSIE